MQWSLRWSDFSQSLQTEKTTSTVPVAYGSGQAVASLQLLGAINGGGRTVREGQATTRGQRLSHLWRSHFARLPPLNVVQTDGQHSRRKQGALPIGQQTGESRIGLSFNPAQHFRIALNRHGISVSIINQHDARYSDNLPLPSRLFSTFRLPALA